MPDLSFRKSHFIWKLALTLCAAIAMVLAAGCFDNQAGNNTSININISLSVTPASVTIAPGQSVPLTVRNPNNISANDVTLMPAANLSGFSIQGSCTSIPAQGQCIVFLTAAANAANQTGNVTIRGQNVNVLTVPVQIAIPLNPVFSVDKSMLALYQNAGSDSMTLTNTGNVNLTGITLSRLPAGVTATDGCSALAVGAQCTFNFTAADSSTVGIYANATLSAVEVAAPVRLTIQISPENQGPTATTLAITSPANDPSSLLVSKGTARVVSLENTGSHALDGPLSITTGTFNSSDVSIISDPGCNSLPAGASCNITVNAAAGSQNYTAVPVTFSAKNVSNIASVAVSVGSPGLFLAQSPPFFIEQDGTLNIVVNNNSDYPATDVNLDGLPAGITRSDSCSSIPANGSCTFVLNAAVTTAIGQHNLALTDGNGDNEIDFALNVTVVTIASSDLANILYVPSGGVSNPITIDNTSTSATAESVNVIGLPIGVSASPCNSIAPGATCQIILNAPAGTPVTPMPLVITVLGANTNDLNGQIMIEQPSLSLNVPTITGPGNITVTVINNSHFTVSNVTPELSGTLSGITLTPDPNNPCGTLAPQGSGGSTSCMFEINTTADSTSVSGAVTVTGIISGMSTPLSTSQPIQLPDPVVTLNGGSSIIMPNASDDILPVPVQVAAGGFSLQNPQPDLTLSQGNDAKVTVSFKDSNNPANDCPDPLVAGNSCKVLLTNTADLDTLGDGNLSVSGDNLSVAARQDVNVVGGLAINYISLNSANAAAYYPRSIDGPLYGVILLQNTGSSSAGDSTFTINTLNPTGGVASIVARSGAADDPVYGSYAQCATTASGSDITNSLAPGSSCIIVLQGAGGNSIGTETGSLEIAAGSNPDIGTASRTFTLTSTGYLYAGGTFTGSINYIAKWDGSAWTGLNTGMNSNVRALTVDSAGNLYAGGDFTTPTNYIAKWDGSAWTGLDSGMGNSVYALTVDSAGNLYAGGTFITPANYIAKWDGSAWTGLNSGMNNSVSALTVDSAGNLYAGGYFTTPASYIAKWDGSAWTGLGSAIRNNVASLAVDSAGNLYAGGYVIIINPVIASVTKWDGSAWTGLDSGLNGIVRALTVDSAGNLYAGGDFNTPSYVAEWDGSAWTGLGSGMNNSVSAFAVDSAGTLYAGGAFTTPANYIAKWDGNAWTGLGSGINGPVIKLAIGRILNVQ